MTISFYRLAQIVKFAVGFGMCLTFSLQFFIAIQIMWPFVEKKMCSFASPKMSELIFRTIMVFVTCNLLFFNLILNENNDLVFKF